MPFIDRDRVYAAVRLSPEEHIALVAAPRKQPQQQWWNIPAKIERGRQIAQEELQRSRRLAGPGGDPHNDDLDAARHARWSARMASEIGPAFSTVAGLEHEIEGTLRGQPLSEALMDMHNNGVGVRAGQRGRPIDPSTLQVTPLSPGRAVRRQYTGP